MTRIAVFFAFFATGASQAYAQTLEPREIAARARPAVVLIHAIAGGESVGQGSGFLVSADGKIVTNRHVIEGAESLRVQLASGEIYERVYIVSDDARRDLVILRIPGAALPTLLLGDDQEAEVGDPVYVMGSPRGLDGTFSDGLLSAKRTLDGIALIQISAPISPGSSGGPVLNGRAEVIGVATLMMRDAQNLNIAVPARYAAGMLSMNETPVLFERVAANFADSDESPSTITSAADDEEEDGVWIRVLRSEMAAATATATKAGLTATHDPFTGLLEENEINSVLFDLSPEDVEVLMVAVCDVDCSDIDILVQDPMGREIARDVDTDDRAVVTFTPRSAGEYKVYVNIPACSAETCGYALLSFSRAK